MCVRPGRDPGCGRVPDRLEASRRGEPGAGGSLSPSCRAGGRDGARPWPEWQTRRPPPAGATTPAIASRSLLFEQIPSVFEQVASAALVTSSPGRGARQFARRRPCFPELQVELSGARRVAVAAAAVGEGSGGNRRRLRRQGRAGHRVPPEQQLVDGVVGQVVGIVAIGMTARDAEDPLADQVRERVPNLPRCAFVGQTPGERLDQAIHALGRLEQDGAAVGTRVFLVERGDEGLVEQIRGTEQSVVSYQVSRRGLRCG